MPKGTVCLHYFIILSSGLNIYFISGKLVSAIWYVHEWKEKKKQLCNWPPLTRSILSSWIRKKNYAIEYPWVDIVSSWILW